MDPSQSEEQGIDIDEYKRSFSALKDSVVQGHDIRKRSKELERFRAQIAADRVTHADMLDILDDYDGIVAEQRSLLDTLRAEYASKSAAEATANTELRAANEQLAALKKAHESELAAIKADHDSKVAAADASHEAAKEARKGVQSRLDAARKEDPDASANAILERELEAARGEEKRTKDTLSTVKSNARKAYRSEKQAREAAERPVQEKVDSLKAEIRRLGAELAANSEGQEKAQSRIAYCAQVQADPSQADELAASIASREADAAQMDSQLEELAHAKAASSASAGKAKLVAGVAIAVIVVILILVLVFSGGSQA